MWQILHCFNRIGNQLAPICFQPGWNVDTVFLSAYNPFIKAMKDMLTVTAIDPRRPSPPGFWSG